MTPRTAEAARRPLRRFAPYALAGFVAHGLLLVIAVWVPLGWYGSPQNALPILVQVVLGVLCWLCYRVPQSTQAAQVVVLAALGVAVVVWGVAAYSTCTGDQAPWWTPLAQTLSLFFGGFDDPFGVVPGCPSQPPLAVQAARLGAITVVGLSVIGALGLLFRSQLERLAARVSPSIIAVVAPAEDAVGYVDRLRSARGRSRIVVFDDKRGVRPTSGVSSVAADPTDPAAVGQFLRRGPASTLRELHILDDNSTRAQSVLDAFSSVQHSARRVAAPPIAVVRIDDVWEAEYWRRRQIATADVLVTDAVSIREGAASMIIDAAARLGCDRLVLVGDPSLAVAVCTENARRARERRARRSAGSPPEPRIVLAGAGSGLLAREPALLQERFGQDSLPVDHTEDAVTLDSIPAMIEGASAPAIVLLDAGTARGASAIAAAFPRVFVFARSAGAGHLDVSVEMERLHRFDTTLDTVRANSWERIARIAHENYLDEFGADPAIAARRPWSELDPFFRESNVRLVTTVMAAAVSIGRSWGPILPGSSAPAFTDSETEMLARAEHDSWRRHREENGWRQGPTDPARRRHEMIVEWDVVGEAGRERTRSSVASVLRLFSVLGYEARRTREDWRRFRRTGTVRAEMLRAPWEWQSDAGDALRAEAGDWRVTDGESSRSVKPTEFHRTHRHVGGDRWMRTGTILARFAQPGETAQTLEGDAVAGEDSWRLRGTGGEEWFVTGDRFVKGYVPDPLGHPGSRPV